MARPTRKETGTARSRASDRVRTPASPPQRPATQTVTRAHSPPPQRTTTHSPGRRSISDRQSRDPSGTGSNLAPIKGRSGTRTKGLGLRWKFMLVFMGVTVSALLILGGILSMTASKYLFSQKVHDGIEVSEVIAALATSVADQLKIYNNAHGNTEETSDSIGQGRKAIVAGLKTYIDQAVRWGSETGNSDVLAVSFNNLEALQEMNGPCFGTNEEGDSHIQEHFPELFLPKNDTTITLPESIKVAQAKRLVDTGLVPIYRFEIGLDAQRFGSKATARVDIDARGVDNVLTNLMITILATVLIASIAVVLFANYLAGNITKPVLILLKDMQVVARGNLDHQTKTHSWMRSASWPASSTA